MNQTSLYENDKKKLWKLSGKITKGFVWRIFFLHFTKPNNYPIFDQHVFRTYNILMLKMNFASTVGLL